MATWTNIPDSVLEPGKPARSVDALALRDNPIAIAEGAAGAPKVQEEAMDVDSINGNRLRKKTITGDLFNDGSVRSWIGSQPAGGVGTYAFVTTSQAGVSWGGTIAGSALTPASATADGISHGPGALSGTWRIMGSQVRATTTADRATLAVRIS